MHDGRERKRFDRARRREERHLWRDRRREMRDGRHYARLVGHGRYYVVWFVIKLVVLLACCAALLAFGHFGPTGRLIVILYAVTGVVGRFMDLGYREHLVRHILRPVGRLSDAAERVGAGDYSVRVSWPVPTEVDGLIDAFNHMTAALEKNEGERRAYEQNRKDLVANISHDLKTPITSIEGYVEALGDARLADPERAGRYLKIIRANAVYMDRLIDDLFLFSKLDLHKLELHLVATSLKPFLADLAEEFSLDLAERGVALSFVDELAAADRAMIDPPQFARVLRNLVGNAVKYGPETGLEIEVGAACARGRCVITVADNGPGIPADKLDRIFERFYRIDTERTKDLSSTGLGLAIAKELVEAHGGRISVRSGAGTCFTINIPALPCPGEKDARNG